MALEDELADELEGVMVVDEVEVARLALAEVVVDRTVVDCVTGELRFHPVFLSGIISSQLTIIVPPITLPLDTPVALAADPDPNLVIIVSSTPPTALPVELDPAIAVAEPEPDVTALAVALS